MITTELYGGQGLGNQLWCYVVTRVIAKDKGYEFGIGSPSKWKGYEFMKLDFGKKVTGGKGNEGERPEILPEGILHYYLEKKIIHPLNGADIRIYDKNLLNISDNTKIDGLMQDEQYIIHRKDEIRDWLKIEQEYECYEYSDKNTCIINLRGGEYTRHPELYLTKTYWENAVNHMQKINKDFRFIVITDDIFAAKKIFPNYDVFHFNIAKDYSIIKNAHYLILSNSSFAWFPAWLSVNLKFCIAPKYWARHNISDGYWSLGYNITSGWHYLDKEGALSNYDSCLKELKKYIAENKEMYSNKNMPKINSRPKNLKDFLREKTPLKIKNMIKALISETKNTLNFIRQPIDILIEKRRKREWLSKVEMAEYRKKIKVYDIFLFFNELELLELRLSILDDYVDYFVIVESTKTFTGLSKKLFYEENKNLFKKWEHKIIHYVVRDTPEDELELSNRLEDKNISSLDREIINNSLKTNNIHQSESHWLREFYQKESMKKALIGLSDNDICFISDLDEIWNPEIVIDYSKDDVYKLHQDVYAYYLNNRSNEPWVGTTVTKFKNIKNTCINHLRTVGKVNHLYLKNGGWHFTNQGGANKVREKIEAYGHQEFNTSGIKENIEEQMKNNKDFVGRHFKFWKDESKLPKYILENKEKYLKLFKE